MTTSIFINALGQAIFESCGQALLIYVVPQLFMQLFPSVSSKYRYDINYLGLTIISCWFLANLVKIYLHNVSLPIYSIAIYNGHVITGPKNIPTLLQQIEAFIVTYAKYITGLYLIGLMLHAFKLIGGFVHIHHIRKQQNLSADGTWTTKVTQLSKLLKVAKTVRLFFSAHVDIPLTIGYFKPIIIFPIALINNLDTEQVEAILLHELAHIKRHDYLLNILQCIMETLLCFNPFVWLISKTIRQEREYCCDDMVMEEEYNTFNYSKALYIIAQQNSQRYALAMASASKNKFPLLNRIKRLNNMKTNDSLPKFHLLVIVTIALIGGLLAWGIPQYSHAKETNRAHYKLVKPLPPPAPVAPLTIPPAPPLPPTTKMTVRFYADTTGNKAATDSIVSHSKAKFKIVMEDDKGNKKEYNSVQELPDSEKNEFLKENPSFSPLVFHSGDSLRLAMLQKFKMDPAMQKQMLAMKIDAEKMGKQFNSPEWKKKWDDQSLEIKKKMEKQFNSPEWKKQVEDMKLQAEKMQSEVNSPEWKKQLNDLQKQMMDVNGPELKKLQDEIKNHITNEVNTPDFKKMQQDIINQIKMQQNSPEWKKMKEQIKADNLKIQQQLTGPEWKKQMKDMQDKIKKEVDENLQKANMDSVKTAN